MQGGKMDDEQDGVPMKAKGKQSVYMSVCTAKEEVTEIFDKHLAECPKLNVEATLLQSCREEVDEALGVLVGLIPPNKEVEDFLFLPSDDVLALRHYTSDLKSTLTDYKERLTQAETAYRQLFQRLNKRDTIIEEMRGTLYKEVCQLKGKLAGRINVSVQPQMDLFDVYNQLEVEIEEVHRYYADLFEKRELKEKRLLDKIILRYKGLLVDKDKELVTKQLEYRNATQRLDSDHNKLLEELRMENIRMKDQAELLRKNLRSQMEGEFAVQLKETVRGLRLELDEEIASLQQALQRSTDEVADLASRNDALQEQLYISNIHTAKNTAQRRVLINHMALEYDSFISDIRAEYVDHLHAKDAELRESRQAHEELQIKAAKIERDLRQELSTALKTWEDEVTQLTNDLTWQRHKAAEADAEIFCAQQIVSRQREEHRHKSMLLEASNRRAEARLVQARVDSEALKKEVTRLRLSGQGRRRSSEVSAEKEALEFRQSYDSTANLLEERQVHFDQEREELLKRNKVTEAEKEALQDALHGLEVTVRQMQVNMGLMKEEAERMAREKRDMASSDATNSKFEIVEPDNVCVGAGVGVDRQKLSRKPKKKNLSTAVSKMVKSSKFSKAAKALTVLSSIKKRSTTPAFEQKPSKRLLDAGTPSAPAPKLSFSALFDNGTVVSSPTTCGSPMSLMGSPRSIVGSPRGSPQFGRHYQTMHDLDIDTVKNTTESDNEEELFEVTAFHRILRKNLQDLKVRMLQEGDHVRALRQGAYIPATVICVTDNDAVVRPTGVDECIDFSTPKGSLLVDEDPITPKAFPHILQKNKELRREIAQLRSNLLKHEGLDNELDDVNADIHLLSVELAEHAVPDSMNGSQSSASPTSKESDKEYGIPDDNVQRPEQRLSKPMVEKQPVWDRVLQRAEMLFEKLSNLRENVLEQRTKEIMATNPLWMRDNSDSDWLPSRATTATPGGSRPPSQLRTTHPGRSMSPYDREQAEWTKAMMMNAMATSTTRKGGGFCGPDNSRTAYDKRFRRPNTVMGFSRCATPPAPSVRPASAEPGSHRRFNFAAEGRKSPRLEEPAPEQGATLDGDERQAGGRHTLNTGGRRSPGVAAPCYPVLPPGCQEAGTIDITAYKDGNVDIVSTACLEEGALTEFAHVMMERFGKAPAGKICRGPPTPPAQPAPVQEPLAADTLQVGTKVHLHIPEGNMRPASPPRVAIPFRAPRPPKEQLEFTPDRATREKRVEHRQKYVPEVDCVGRSISPRAASIPTPKQQSTVRPYSKSQKAHVKPPMTWHCLRIT